MWDSLTTEDSYRISNTKNSHMFICLWYREIMESNIGTLLQQASTSDMWSNDHKCAESPPCSHLTRNSHNYVFTSVNFCSLFFCQLFLVCLYAHKEMTCPGLLTILFADSRIAHYNLIHYLICLPRSFSKDLSRKRRGPSLLYHTFRLFTFVSAPTSPSLRKSPVWPQRPGTWLCYNPCSDFGKEAFPPFYCSKDILHLPLLRGTYSWTVYIFFCDLIIFFHVNYLCIPIKLCIYCIPTKKNMRVVCKGICTSINTHLEGIKEQQKQITIVDYIQYK